jgi:SAM-dependent MidA family methyltransferase
MSRRSSKDTEASESEGEGPSVKGTTLPSAGAESSLGARLRDRIRRGGAITFREWVRAALYDENGGYYRRPDAERWGRAGDYRTSPERSPLFAATFARRFASIFDETGSSSLYLLEAGGGAGHFAHGVLRTLSRDAPNVFSKLRYVFDETSDDSRRSTVQLLAPFGETVEFRRLQDIKEPLDPIIVFSNELLDAFPVNRVVTRDGELRELYVDVDGEGDFVWVEGPPSTPRLAEHFEQMGAAPSEGQFAEVNLEAEEWMARVGGIVGRGYVFTVDYGDEAAGLINAPHGRDGTLRAFRGHEFVEDVLSRPGEQDLTTTVNWTQVASAGESAGLRTVMLERLDTFLLNAGLLEQLERESEEAIAEAEVTSLRLGAREMILPGGMAAHFQVLVQRKI